MKCRKRTEGHSYQGVYNCRYPAIDKEDLMPVEYVIEMQTLRNKQECAAQYNVPMRDWCNNFDKETIQVTGVITINMKKVMERNNPQQHG